MSKKEVKLTCICKSDNKEIEIYSILTRRVKLALYNKLKESGITPKLYHLEFYRYLLEEQKLDVITKSNQTMKDEMIFPISIRVIQYIKKDFEKIGIIIPVTAGFKFKKIETEINSDQNSEHEKSRAGDSENKKAAQSADKLLHDMHPRNSPNLPKNSYLNLNSLLEIKKYLLSYGISDYQYNKYISVFPKEHIIDRINQFIFVRNNFSYRIKNNAKYLYNSITCKKWIDRDYLRFVNENIVPEKPKFSLKDLGIPENPGIATKNSENEISEEKLNFMKKFEEALKNKVA